MKTLRIASMCMCFLGALCSVTKASTKEGYVSLKKPILVSEVGIYNYSTISLVAWQEINKSCYEGDLRPVIEEGHLKGWNFNYTEGKDPVPFECKYVKCDSSFKIPAGMTENQVVTEMLKIISRRLDKTKIMPVALNKQAVDTETVVYGMWIGYIKDGLLWNKKINRFEFISPDYRKIDSRRGTLLSLSFKVPDFAIPQTVNKSEGDKVSAYSTIKKTEDGKEIVLLPAFIVQEFRSLIDLNVVTVGEKVYEVKVAKVFRGRSFDKAGVEEGMLIKSINGVYVKGIRKDGIEALVLRTLSTGNFELEVGPRDGDPLKVCVPVQKLRSKTESQTLASVDQ